MLSRADVIWNRACDPAFQPRLPGDRALFDVIRFDAEVNSGGLEFAIDEDGYAAAGAAAEGLRVLGAADRAVLLDEIRTTVSRVLDGDGRIDILDLNDEELAKLEFLQEKYWELLPTDLLNEILESHLASHPEAFEPVDAD